MLLSIKSGKRRIFVGRENLSRGNRKGRLEKRVCIFRTQIVIYRIINCRVNNKRHHPDIGRRQRLLAVPRISRKNAAQKAVYGNGCYFRNRVFAEFGENMLLYNVFVLTVRRHFYFHTVECQPIFRNGRKSDYIGIIVNRF